MLFPHDVNESEIERDDITGGKSVCYKLATVSTESDKTKVELDRLDLLSQHSCAGLVLRSAGQ